MSRDTYFEHYAPMDSTNTSGEQEEMKVTIYYSLGGYGFRRGIYLSFYPVHRTGFSESCTIPDARSHLILLEELPRKSKKAGELWAQIIGRDVDRIAAAAIAGQLSQIKSFLLGYKAA